MARIQILELPEGSSDDRPPFVLVVDEASYPTVEAYQTAQAWWQQLSQQLGAQGCVVTDDTIDIPANEVPLDEDGHPLFLKVHVEGEFEQFREQVQQEVLAAQGKITRALQETDPVHERVDIARDTDRLAKWKNEITDALGVDRFHYWEDIRNAAAGLRQERDAQAAEIARLRAGEEPTADKGVVPTPAQWIWHWNQATPEKRLSMAEQIQDGMTRSNNCFMADHETQITRLRAEIDRLVAESAGATNPDA